MKVFIAIAITALVVTATATAVPSPDDRAFSRSPALEAAARSSINPDDRAFSRSPALEAQYVPEPVQVVVHDKDGYHWLDAGEGVVVGFVFAMLLAALALLIARSRRPVPAV
jgi:hypothetical protein